MPLLSVDNLRVHFHTRDGVVRAVDGISYAIEPGETLGIVGESGSGKSVSQYALLGLLPTPPARIESGTATFSGKDLLRSTRRDQRAIRGKRISMIFQDPMTALNPYMRVGDQLTEPLRIHDGVPRRQAQDAAVEALAQVGIQDGASRLNMFPHEFSGGMRQRIMIAMALITKPELLIADEPTTALDVTVQAQILNLIKRNQQELGMAVVLITHDLGVVAGTCDHVAVMYAGRLVEKAPVKQLFAAPKHPYTQALMASLPAVHQRGDKLYTIPGLPPDLIQPMTGCRFAPRCEFAEDACRAEDLQLAAIDTHHETTCRRIHAGTITLDGVRHRETGAAAP
jgi:oligopeptide transport system ATP-binding protein